MMETLSKSSLTLFKFRGYSSRQNLVKILIISVQDQTIHFSPSPTHRKLKDVIEPAKFELRKVIGAEHNLILLSGQDIESAIHEGQTVVFEVEGPQVIGSIMSRLNKVESEISNLNADKSFDKYVYVVQDVNAKDFLEKDQSIPWHVRRKLTELRQGHNLVAHYIDDKDTASLKQYKLQVFRNRWLSMPADIRKKFSFRFGPAFYREISRSLAAYKPGRGKDGIAQLSPTEATKADEWVKSWWED